MKVLDSRRHTILAVAIAAVSLTGCAGAADDGAQAPEREQPPTDHREAPSAPGTVAMKDVKFMPDRLTIAVGDRVTWRNDESLDHNVVAQKGAKFRSRAFGKGETFTFVAKKPGTIAYVCTLHPGMDGQLIVTPDDGRS